MENGVQDVLPVS